MNSVKNDKNLMLEIECLNIDNNNTNIINNELICEKSNQETVDFIENDNNI